MSKGVWARQFLMLWIPVAAISPFCWGTDSTQASVPAPGPGLYMKVQLAGPLRISKLKPGDSVNGSLARDAYSADRKLYPAGTAVRLTVDHLEKRARSRNDHWPWAVHVFTPRKENYPVFRKATVNAGQLEVSLDVALVSISRMREVQAKSKKDNKSHSEAGAVETSKSSARKPVAPVMVLEAFGVERDSVAGIRNDSASVDQGQDSPIPAAIPAGTRCKILLLGNVSASKSFPGDEVPARLLEPVILNSHVVLPAGTVFKGRVVKKTPPRWLSRPGSLYLIFTEVTLPEGTHLPIAASVASAELDEKSHTSLDPEGKLHGEHPGKAWMAINFGVSAGISKGADDGIQFVIEALVSSATDVSTAGTSRIVSSCVSGLYMATRHGRDVVLPRFTEMDISLDRAVPLDAGNSVQLSLVATGRN